MLKRILILLAALVLALPASAQELTCDALYLLVNRDAQGQDTPIGSAVLFLNNTSLLTTTWAIDAPDDLYAIGAGGALKVTGAGMLSEADNLVLLKLETPSPAAPLSEGQLSSELLVLGFRRDGTPCIAPAISPSMIPYGDDEFQLLYTAPEALLPGSVLADAGFGLSGVATAAYGEGVNRLVALPYEMLYDRLISATMPEGVSWIDGFTATAGTGAIQVDWSMCNTTCDRGDCVTGLFFSDAANPFFTYFKADEGKTSTEILAAPGRTYRVWLQHAHGDLTIEVNRPARYAATVTLPPAQPYAQFNFADQEIYLGYTPVGQESLYLTKVPPLEAITAQALEDPNISLFLQVTSTYTVEENSECDLLILLSTPEGYLFSHQGRFLFDTGLQDQDTWHANITKLFRDYLAFNQAGHMTSGEYTLSYCLDGAFVNQITWTLE